ncbi:hypothetical protein NL676_032647 [Syzygium grande]|nr:hypothetical protein NL676_032647 [Syzygium grande]
MKHRDRAPTWSPQEAGDCVDGNITTVERDGYLWEEGPNSFQPFRDLYVLSILFRDFFPSVPFRDLGKEENGEDKAIIGQMLKNTETSLRKMETRKAELETNLATNLKRQKQEYRAIMFSSKTDLHENEAESKWQELKDTKSLVIDATQRLEGGNFGLIGILLS